jgi:hypothetical protein
MSCQETGAIVNFDGRCIGFLLLLAVNQDQPTSHSISLLFYDNVYYYSLLYEGDFRALWFCLVLFSFSLISFSHLYSHNTAAHFSILPSIRKKSIARYRVDGPMWSVDPAGLGRMNGLSEPAGTQQQNRCHWMGLKALTKQQRCGICPLSAVQLAVSILLPVPFSLRRSRSKGLNAFNPSPSAHLKC